MSGQEGTIDIASSGDSVDSLVREYLDFLQELHSEHLNSNTQKTSSIEPTSMNPTEQSATSIFSSLYSFFSRPTFTQMYMTKTGEVAAQVDEVDKAEAWESVLTSARALIPLNQHRLSMHKQEASKRVALTERYWRSCPEYSTIPDNEEYQRAGMDELLLMKGEEAYSHRWVSIAAERAGHQDELAMNWSRAVEGPLRDTQTRFFREKDYQSVLGFTQPPSYTDLESIYRWNENGRQSPCPAPPTGWTGNSDDLASLVPLATRIHFDHQHSQAMKSRGQE
ncbi:uncharacterized protein I303_103395 [Kwoniella dejecticola CBS 10117]|uniref:Uncharacterized protein n=1 Tax=Kwoniella dejecticola CBS 10117 TaxID=1296121 RepID=A0A1A6A6M1_9TREE|nr:uncharacterized protein I303_03418 [Kwoniella dejecticola CBS 10117]OBR85707.1 hypothetical protein I303_03418 [Kwoniella dejecticola CBS 10117]